MSKNYKAMGSLTHVYDPMYMINYYGSCGVTKKTFKKNLEKHLNFPTETLGRLGSGVFFVTDDGEMPTGFIWSEDKDIYLAHECMHASIWALGRAGLSVSIESEEAYTYYQSFLMTQLLRRG